MKKQIVELLSAICLYSGDGLKKCMDALEEYRVSYVPYHSNSDAQLQFHHMWTLAGLWDAVPSVSYILGCSIVGFSPNYPY